MTRNYRNRLSNVGDVYATSDYLNLAIISSALTFWMRALCR